MLTTFMKTDACGNDFIVFDCADAARADEIKNRARALCDRRRGIGADGIICAVPTDGGADFNTRSGADFKMRIFNSDGSEAEMCGNGVRCLAEYLRVTNRFPRGGCHAQSDDRLAQSDGGNARKNAVALDTLAGIITVEFAGVCETGGGNYRVNMGAPRFAPDDVPVIPVDLGDADFIMKELCARDNVFKVTALSMGNPHAVVFAEELDDELVLGCGPAIQTHPFFPRGVNVEFVKIISRNEIRMRVYERGCGETPACGTGACAAAAAGVVNGMLENNVAARLPGGVLQIEWNGEKDAPVYMSGNAKAVYAGTIYEYNECVI